MNITALLPLISLDEALFKFINSHHSGVFDVFFRACSAFGSSWGIVPAFTAFILFTAKKRRAWILICAGAVMLIGGAFLTSAIKHGLERPRPAIRFETSALQTAAAEESFAVHIVGPRLDNSYSFPSGHSWTAFAVAAFLTLFFGRRYRWAYLVAAAIGFSRIYVGAHFPLDVAGGAVCGTLLALLVWLLTVRLAPQAANPAARRCSRG